MFNIPGGFVAPADVGLVVGPGHIQDDAIRAFHDVLALHTPYRPVVFDYLQFPENFPSIPQGQPHLQVVFRETLAGSLSDIGHWIAVFYDGSVLNIYDSLSYNNLTQLQSRFIYSLFPFKPPIIYKHVQQQTDSIFCGLFATAFVTSIALNRDPCVERYKVECMRNHLAGIIQNGQLTPFPTIESVTSRAAVFGSPRISPAWSVAANERVNIKKQAQQKAKNKEKEKKNRRRANIKASIESGISPFSPSSSPLVKRKCISSPDVRVNLNICHNDESSHHDLTSIVSSCLEGTHNVFHTGGNRDDDDLNPDRPINFSQTRSRSLHRTLRTSKRQNVIHQTSCEDIAILKTDVVITKHIRGSNQPSCHHMTTRLKEAARNLNPRVDAKYRKSEQQKDTLAHRKARLDSDYRASEQERNTQAHRKTRLDSDYRASEQERNTLAHRKTRLDSDCRASEQERNTLAHRKTRLDSDYRASEQERNTQAHRETRLDSNYRSSERVRDAQVRRETRLDLDRRDFERQRDTQARRLARTNSDYITSEATQRQLRAAACNADWEKVTAKFLKNVSDGNSYTCNCCGRLFNGKSIINLTKSSVFCRNRSLPPTFINDVFYLHPGSESGNFCSTCAVFIKKGIIPKMACCNGLVFPPVPQVLSELSPLEERLVSPRHVFLKIVRRGYGLGYQHGLVGNVVNVPVEVDSMVSMLPRSSSDNHVITVELKRRLCYRHGRKERVRPDIIRQAASYLVQTDLFKDLGIFLDPEWEIEDNVDDTHQCTCSADPDINECDDIEEEVEPINPGGQETLLDTDDVTLVMAPGEGKKPLSLIFDDNLEELAFIKVHCGQRREFKSKLTHLDITKSEISRHDRRAVRPDYLFTALKKEQMLAIKSNITTCLRKKSTGGSLIQVENLLDDSFINNLVQHDEGYRVLKSIRNSPAHWESEKKKVLAMIRQFGVPTLFITLSAAETRWPELLVLLKKVVDDERISLEDAERLPYNDKARLIQTDPFICATYFELRLQELRKTWRSSNGPFGEYEIGNFYYRIEFQHRGSPHAHIMIWLKGAPVFQLNSPDSMVEVTNFVDGIISCSGLELVDELLTLQKHKHTHTCHPKPGRPCRFEIPFFPMDRTVVLTELDTEDEAYKNAKELGMGIKEKLEALPPHLESFEDFLQFLNITYKQYELAVRSTLKKPKLFLRRHPKDVMTNPFSKKIIELHRANMDIQFILDPFACAQYVVNYINKADRGMSRLLRSAVEEVKKGDKGIKESLRSISNVFLNSSEISAQEAVYCLVGIPMSRTSESEVYINTSPPDQRVHILRSKQELAHLEPSSTDIFLPNLVDHYTNRPNNDIFNTMPLAEFAAYYTYAKKAPKKVTNSNDNCEDQDQLSYEPCGKWIPLQKGGWIRRRSKPKIIRFRNYNLHQDQDNFYREQLMLYLPWRNEYEELLDHSINLEQKFKGSSDFIKEVYGKFSKLGGPDQFHTFIAAIHEVEAGFDDDGENEVRQARNRRPLDGYEFEEQVGDVMDDIVPGGHPGPDQARNPGVVIAQPPPVTESDLLTMTRLLNYEQRSILLHIIHHFQTQTISSSQLYIFVSGGAGVGKSVFIKTLYQCLMAYFNLEPGSNPDDMKILLTAPTGKAAFGIGGQTVHSALGLPISQAGNIVPELSPSVANTLACKLSKLRLIVIDEISMVGSRTFHQINRRLQQLFHSSKLFGGIPLIVVGDLKQLPPVGDNWIFQTNSNNQLAVLAGTPLWDLFKMFELKRIMRQRDDFSFATALNNMSTGAMNDEDIALLKARTFTSATLPAEAEGAVHLFTSNREVDKYNEVALSKMSTESAAVLAIDVVSGSPNRNATEKALKTVSSLPTTQTYGLAKSIFLRVGARYMMTVNVDTSDGLVNGSTGRLRKIDYGVNQSGDRRPMRLWLEFDEASAGRSKRSVFNKADTLRLGTNHWTPIESVSYTVKRWKSSNLQVHRTQFPLVPAEAITVHKSQGATMDKVVVHLKPPNKRPIMYVACSRAKSASGLFIVAEKGFEPPPPPASTNSVLQEMQKLRSSALVPMFKFLSDSGINETQAIFHNVQSLRKHEEDVALDPAISASNVLMLVETWSSPQDKFNLLTNLGFVEVSRTNGPQKNAANPGMGVLIMVKQELVLGGNVLLPQGGSLTRYNDDGNCEIAWTIVNNTVIITVYKSPRCPLNILLQLLDSALGKLSKPSLPLVVAGDFNVNLNSSNNLVDYFRSHNLQPVTSLTAETTRGHTTIDGVFATTTCQGGVYESFFGYHRPLWLRY